MQYRKHTNKKTDKRIFSKSADRTHKYNVKPMRGGYRL